MAELVRITDVSPRDGLQNEAGVIPTAEKIELVKLLCAAGVDEVEVSSFVSPKWVPQLGDASEVFLALGSTIPRRQGGCGVRLPMLSALVPNEKGYQAAIDVNEAAGTRLIDKISLFTAASETFSRRNTNATIAETMERFKPVARRALDAQLSVRGYVSCAIACPFEGPVPPDRVASVACDLLRIGVQEIDLGDTIGAGTAASVSLMLKVVREEVERQLQREHVGGWVVPGFTLHLHDTFGRAAECVKAALDMGVRSFDGSVAGLGGCPYASTPTTRAPGNISTELLVQTVEAAGYKTNVDLAKLNVAADFARRIVSASRKSSGGRA